MAIRKRGDSFLVDVTVKGKRLYATVPTEALASSKEKELIEELTYGVSSQVIQKRGWTLKEAFLKTEATVWSGSKSEGGSIRNAEEALKFFGGSRLLEDISTDMLDGYVDHLRQVEHNADSTINRKLAAVSKMMTVACQRGHLKAKPYIPRKKESQGRVRWVTQEEEAKMLQLIAQWGQDDFYDTIVCLIDTGLRIGELRKLTERDVDFTTNMVTVWETKNGDSRSVPMTERVQSIMARRKGTFAFSKNWIRTPWDRLRGIMGLAQDDQFVPHCLRHTCASRLIQRGVGLSVVQQWMGHKSIQITLRYAHLAPSNLADAVKALEIKPQISLVRKAI